MYEGSKKSANKYENLHCSINNNREGTEGDDIRSRIVERSSGSVAPDLGRWDSETRTSELPLVAYLAPLLYE